MEKGPASGCTEAELRLGLKRSHTSAPFKLPPLTLNPMENGLGGLGYF